MPKTFCQTVKKVSGRLAACTIFRPSAPAGIAPPGPHTTRHNRRRTSAQTHRRSPGQPPPDPPARRRPPYRRPRAGQVGHAGRIGYSPCAAARRAVDARGPHRDQQFTRHRHRSGRCTRAAPRGAVAGDLDGAHRDASVLTARTRRRGIVACRGHGFGHRRVGRRLAALARFTRLTGSRGSRRGPRSPRSPRSPRPPRSPRSPRSPKSRRGRSSSTKPSGRSSSAFMLSLMRPFSSVSSTLTLTIWPSFSRS